jgi:hypothetical protein
MAPGATVNVTIVGRIATQDRAERTYRNTAQVTANEAETDYTDNSALVTTRYIVPCTYPVLDGGFEAGTPSLYWSESSTNFGTPLCTLAGCGSGGDTAGPRSGTWWSWFGGVPGPETGALAQALVLPLGKARLTFFLWNGAASGNGTDVFRVLVDATAVFSAFEGAGAYTAGYTPVVLDLSRFADGASHVLRFEAQTSGPEVTTFSLDDVMIEAGPRARPRSSPLVCP